MKVYFLEIANDKLPVVLYTTTEPPNYKQIFKSVLNSLKYLYLEVNEFWYHSLKERNIELYNEIENVK